MTTAMTGAIEHRSRITDENNTFIEKHGMAEYAKWHLGEEGRR